MMNQVSKVHTDVAYIMGIKIEDFCPFVCSINQLNEGKNFNKIKKRQLMSNFNLSYASQTKIVKVPIRPVIGTVNKALYDFGASLMTEI